jgi:HEAT repeat protein
VRKDAAVSFALLFTPQNLPALEEMSLDTSWVVRQAAAFVFRSLARENAEGAMHLVARLARDPVPNVRVAAARGAVELADRVRGNGQLDAILDEVEQDPDVDVRNAGQ